MDIVVCPFRTTQIANAGSVLTCRSAPLLLILHLDDIGKQLLVHRLAMVEILKDGAASEASIRHDVFGAEVVGVDLSRSIEAKLRKTLRALIAHYQLLVFRDQRISPEGQQAFTLCFGDPEPGIASRPANHQVNGHRGILHLHNRPGSATAEYGQSWHSDGLAYARVPHGVTVLRCKACPAGLGDTLFASQMVAYAAMLEDFQGRIEELYWHLPPMPFSEIPRDRGLAQPIVRNHPLTGRRFIYCAPNARQILGWTVERSAEILSVVHAYQLIESAIYRHSWRRDDVIVWENCSILHNRADAVDYAMHGLRELHRTATVGTFEAIECEPAD